MYVAECDPDTVLQPKAKKRIERTERVIEILIIVPNARLARHVKKVVTHQFAPHAADLSHFGVEAVTANVVAITLVGLGAGNASYHGIRLEHRGWHLAFAQFVCGRQAGSPRPENDDMFVHGRSYRIENVCSGLGI